MTAIPTRDPLADAISDIEPIAPFQPDYPPTPSEKRARDAAAAQRIKDLNLGSFAAAVARTPFAYVADQIGRIGTADDPDFVLTEEEFKRSSDGLPPEYWPELGNATSLDDLHVIRAQLMTRAVATEKMASLGWSGFGL